MSDLQFVNISVWRPEQVANWLKGLDMVLEQYIPEFVRAGIDGQKLLILTNMDLKKLGVFKVGHQEMLLEAVDLIYAIHNELETENMQYLALKLGCCTTSLCRTLKLMQHQGVTCDLRSIRRLPLIILSTVADIIGKLKCLVSWFDRPPFDSSEGYIKMRNSLVKMGLDLLSATQHVSENSKDRIAMACEDMSKMCDRIMTELKDPLVIQPAALELATIRKKPEDELGMHIESSHTGTHIIGGVKAESPADHCGKIEVGDEVVQVNYKTVVGWQLQDLVNELRTNKKEVTLTLKKRPHHTSLYGLPGNRQKYARKMKQGTGTFPKSSSRKRSSKRGRIPRPDLVSPIPAPSAPFSEICSLKETDTDNEIDNDNEVFHTGSSGDVTSGAPLHFQIEAKQRRATVSGGSPRLSIKGNELSDAATRPKSCTITVSSPSSESSHASIGSPVTEFRHMSLGSIESELRLTCVASELSVASCDSALVNVESLESTEPALQAPLSPVCEEQRDTPPKQDVHAPVSATVSLPPDVSSGGGRTWFPVSETRSCSVSAVETAALGTQFPVLELQSLPGMMSPKYCKGSEIPGDVSGSPRLVRLKHIDSMRRAELSAQQDKPWGSDPSGGTPVTTGSIPENRPVSFTTSYTVNIVGGVPQKIPVISRSKEEDVLPQSPTVMLRRNLQKKIGGNRRISCKDLGHGDCQGWLWKKRTEGAGLMASRWVKRWFVLKNQNLYYYKGPDDQKAQGVLHLPSFQVSPSKETKSKKYAFKAHHAGTTFYFAAERQNDMVKWMNKMGLAAIVFDASHFETTAGFVRHGVLPSQSSQVASYSESEDEEKDTMSTSSNPATPRSGTPEPGLQTLIESPLPTPTPSSSCSEITSDPLTSLLRNINKAKLGIDGCDIGVRRTSTMRPMKPITGDRRSNEVNVARKLASLQRTCKDKEHEVEIIEAFLAASPVTATRLHEFERLHPHIMRLIQDGSNDGSYQSPSSDDS